MAERLDGRNGEVWRRFIGGETQESIAEGLGISQGRVSQIVKAVRQSIPDEDKADIVKGAVDQLAWLSTELVALVNSQPVPAYSNGRPIMNADGTPAMDHSGRLAAMDRLLKVQERAAKYLGLDAPTEQRIDVSGLRRAASEQATTAASEAAARLAAAGTRSLPGPQGPQGTEGQ